MSAISRSRAAAALVAALLVAITGGCGDSGTTTSAKDTPSASADPVAGEWLLRFTTAEGADGERSRAVFVRFDPATGAASSRKLPATIATDASQDEQVLLVSADHAWALPDTGVPKAEAGTGRLVLYSVTSDATQTLDIRAATGRPTLRARAWAFDPSDAHVLRVVDSGLGVWKVDLATKTATLESTLSPRSGWIFANGFDKSTGEPYVESIDSDQTDPAGNGDSDLRPVERQGGSLVRYDGEALKGLPTPPCGLAGGFQFDGGLAWLFCADTPSITAYQAHADGASWHTFGRPSPRIVPRTVAELTFALPPVA
jgi:hypothetical protein